MAQFWENTSEYYQQLSAFDAAYVKSVGSLNVKKTQLTRLTINQESNADYIFQELKASLL